MKIKINEKEYDLHYSLRIYMIYENVANKALDNSNLKISDLILLFYAAVVATLQYNKADLISYLEFLDYIDDNGGEQLITEFGDWFSGQLMAQSKLQQEAPKTKDNKKK